MTAFSLASCCTSNLFLLQNMIVYCLIDGSSTPLFSLSSLCWHTRFLVIIEADAICSEIAMVTGMAGVTGPCSSFAVLLMVAIILLLMMTSGASDRKSVV